MTRATDSLSASAETLAHGVGLVLQGRATNPNLDPKEPEGLFRDHVVELHKRACAGKLAMLCLSHTSAVFFLDSPMSLSPFWR